MAKMRRVDSKAALARQRAEVRRGARGKMHVGDDTGSAAARAAEREKVHRMQALQREHEQQDSPREAENRRQALALSEHRRYGDRHRERLGEPILALFGELLADSLRLARTFVLLPFRLASALRGHRRPGATGA
jgi:hypothetical protein